MNQEHFQKLNKIMWIARNLCWLTKSTNGGYPSMIASEVEKCILMALDDEEMSRFEKAAKNNKIVAINRQINPDFA